MRHMQTRATENLIHLLNSTGRRRGSTLGRYILVWSAVKMVKCLQVCTGSAS